MRVSVAMSGGVDSSVAALLLKEKGCDVIGLTIKTWPKEDCGDSGDKLCCSLESIQYARSVSEELGIPYYVIDLSKEFEEIIKTYFVNEYVSGKTPNPCIYCNSKIKFGLLYDKARALGAERIATGHYARILKKDSVYYLLEAADKKQDQSYFLYDIPKEMLKFIEFPLGELAKKEVRELAEAHNLMTAHRKSSQDICFTNEKSGYRGYLEEMGITFKSGDIIDTRGKVIGKHKGIACYTIGQRHGIGLAMPKAVYVLKIDTQNNTITVGDRSYAMHKRIRVGRFNWLMADIPKDDREFDVKIRYNASKVKARFIPQDDDEAIVELAKEQFAPTPGQAAVFYDGEIVVGGGWIEEVVE